MIEHFGQFDCLGKIPPGLLGLAGKLPRITALGMCADARIVATKGVCEMTMLRHVVK